MSNGMLEGKVIAEIGVALAIERLLRAGFGVAVPVVDEGYDLLAFSDRRYWRIQVKASECRSSSSRIRITRGGRRYCHREVDAFIAVNTRTNVVMCVPVADTHGRAWITLREGSRWRDMGVLRRIKNKRC
jgi:hypothetical protein